MLLSLSMPIITAKFALLCDQATKIIQPHTEIDSDGVTVKFWYYLQYRSQTNKIRLNVHIWDILSFICSKNKDLGLEKSTFLLPATLTMVFSHVRHMNLVFR